MKLECKACLVVTDMKTMSKCPNCGNGTFISKPDDYGGMDQEALNGIASRKALSREEFLEIFKSCASK